MTDDETALEFVHASTERDLRDGGRLAATPGLSGAGIEPPPGAGEDRDTAQHLFLLRHRGEPVAALWTRGLRSDEADAAATTWVVERVLTRERSGPGCSYRLLLILWSTQWLLAHASLRTVVASCRTDALHRYAPMGFGTVGTWFRGGSGDGVVEISANALDVLAAGRELGLGRVLESALIARGGIGRLSERMGVAA
jgi:hypothetical protein